MRSVRILIMGVALLVMLLATWLLGGRPSDVPASPGASGGAPVLRPGSGVGGEVEDRAMDAPVSGRRELDPTPGGSLDDPTQTVRVQVIHAETRAPVPHAELVTWPPNDDPLDIRHDERFSELLRERVEIRPGLEAKRLTADAARLRSALESLGR